MIARPHIFTRVAVHCRVANGNTDRVQLPNRRIARKELESQQKRNERIRKSRSESADMTSSLAGIIDQDAIQVRFDALGRFLNERDRRLFADDAIIRARALTAKWAVGSLRRGSALCCV
jgi:hypothetical protein